jgi:hypothetical protein
MFETMTGGKIERITFLFTSTVCYTNEEKVPQKTQSQPLSHFPSQYESHNHTDEDAGNALSTEHAA